MQQAHPNQVQVLGPDVMVSGSNGNTLRLFQVLTGVSFTLLRDCADGSVLSDTNLIRPYNMRENYVVINKQGIIRYHADDFWDYGDRYHPSEILGTVDSLVTHGVDVPNLRPPAWSLAVTPNPAHGLVVLTLGNPTTVDESARVRVHDLAGRIVAELPPAVASAGLSHMFWDARDGRGEHLPAGVYLVEAQVHGQRLIRRIALTR